MSHSYKIQGNCFHKRVIFEPDTPSGKKGIRIYSKSMAAFLKCFGKKIDTYKTDNGKILYLDRNSYKKWVHKHRCQFIPSAITEKQIQSVLAYAKMSIALNPSERNLLEVLEKIDSNQDLKKITETLEKVEWDKVVEISKVFGIVNPNKTARFVNAFNIEDKTSEESKRVLKFLLSVPLKIEGLSLLAYGASIGKLEAIKLLVEQGASVDVDTDKDHFEKSPLFQAFSSTSDQKYSIIEFLLGKNATILFEWLPDISLTAMNLCLEDGYTKYIYSIAENDDRTLSLIINHLIRKDRELAINLLNRFEQFTMFKHILSMDRIIRIFLVHGIYLYAPKEDSLKRLFTLRKKLVQEKVLSKLNEIDYGILKDNLRIIVDYMDDCEEGLTPDDIKDIAQVLLADDAKRIQPRGA